MPNFQSRAQQAPSEEFPEFPFRGPFSGIQSELPPDLIEAFAGFLDLSNVILRNNRVTVRPGYTQLAAMPDPQEPIVGIADFFDRQGARHQVVMTPTRLLAWNGGWTDIPGGPMTGAASQLFDWAVCDYQLLFSQGIDKIWTWDGLAGTFTQVSANAPAAFHMFELDFQLVACNTVEGGVAFPQRIRWSGTDPTDWTSLNAGVQDIINDLGPIHHGVKLYQYGYLMQHFGITQMIPTGSAQLPFDFIPISSNNKGTYYDNSCAHQGGEFICYVGVDNVYMFDGTTVTPIGDRAIQGGHLGARSRILSDLAMASSTSSVTGYITTMVGTQWYNAYWLNIPGVSMWIYNIDEQNWTRFSYTKTPSTTGRFALSLAIPRIEDLVGTIAAQTFTPAGLSASAKSDGYLIGMTDGTFAYVDFTNYSELSWSITSGQHSFQDIRHRHAVKKWRLSIFDVGQITFSVSVTGILYPNPSDALDANGNPISTDNNTQTQTQVITMGNGSNKVVTKVIAFSIPGNYISWVVQGLAGVPASFIEFTPIFDIEGEQPSN